MKETFPMMHVEKAEAQKRTASVHNPRRHLRALLYQLTTHLLIIEALRSFHEDYWRTTSKALGVTGSQLKLY
jgi:hypothetical protein